MGIPSLDPHHQVASSAFDLALPLSVLHGCQMIPVGSYIQIDAILRLGEPQAREKKHPVRLHISKDCYNLQISVIDKGRGGFLGGQQYYCVVGGKKPKGKKAQSEEESDSEDGAEEEEVPVEQEVWDTSQDVGVGTVHVSMEADAARAEQDALDEIPEDPLEALEEDVVVDSPQKTPRIISEESATEPSNIPQMSPSIESQEQKDVDEEKHFKGKRGRKKKEPICETPVSEEVPTSSRSTRKRKIEEVEDNSVVDGDVDSEEDVLSKMTTPAAVDGSVRRNPGRSNRMSKMKQMMDEYHVGSPARKKANLKQAAEETPKRAVRGLKKDAPTPKLSKRVGIKVIDEKPLELPELRVKLERVDRSTRSARREELSTASTPQKAKSKRKGVSTPAESKVESKLGEDGNLAESKTSGEEQNVAEPKKSKVKTQKMRKEQAPTQSDDAAEIEIPQEEIPHEFPSKETEVSSQSTETSPKPTPNSTAKQVKLEEKDKKKAPKARKIKVEDPEFEGAKKKKVPTATLR